MAAAKRDFAREYRRRIERQMARGFSRSQARGHPSAKKQEQAISTITKRPLRGAAKRGAEARQAREVPRAVFRPSSVSWTRTTPGGSRYVVTSDPRVVLEALRQSQPDGRDVLINVTGEIDESYRGDRKKRGYASTGWHDPVDLLSEIGDEPEAVEVAVATACSEQGYLVASIDTYTVKQRL